MILDDVVAFLRKVPPFQFLDDENLHTVARNLSMEFYPKDTVILEQDGGTAGASPSFHEVAELSCGNWVLLCEAGERR